ncbi:hypothetical protein DFH06DRAFT_1139045 [Mycena polygramma]|nr:hypothetical protein DFH06DRAFT_1139045 [Mycena polygramma]
MAKVKVSARDHDHARTGHTSDLGAGLVEESSGDRKPVATEPRRRYTVTAAAVQTKSGVRPVGTARVGRICGVIRYDTRLQRGVLSVRVPGFRAQGNSPGIVGTGAHDKHGEKGRKKNADGIGARSLVHAARTGRQKSGQMRQGQERTAEQINPSADTHLLASFLRRLHRLEHLIEQRLAALSVDSTVIWRSGNETRFCALPAAYCAGSPSSAGVDDWGRGGRRVQKGGGAEHSHTRWWLVDIGNLHLVPAATYFTYFTAVNYGLFYPLLRNFSSLLNGQGAAAKPRPILKSISLEQPELGRIPAWNHATVRGTYFPRHYDLSNKPASCASILALSCLLFSAAVFPSSSTFNSRAAIHATLKLLPGAFPVAQAEHPPIDCTTCLFIYRNARTAAKAWWATDQPQRSGLATASSAA